ncbi:unnamed protein product [Rotaria sordida]|uniref:Methyltransferase n=1 Tax=Rotaria sordida TaxID=392033 RepID=A0A818ZPZ9_9BILA|nr:unnamed protein product [Rotaria sordida]CAF0758878.1 unnamed protein product [Rotaria sordida]CAF0802632.1 unnamed protein product [Rotaria sordida]CAF3680028.1 unnamed protein product [Rotaria sordida]CAF3767144.1 unnamed protein product [Rotaria sordida]
MTEKTVLKRSSNAVQKEVSSYNELYQDSTSIDKRKNQYKTLITNYYSLSTDFYEYGWGQSFHFANRFRGETLAESIQRHESYLTLKMNLKPGDKVLDIGCGVGGPLRRIAYLTGAHVTGLTISEYQVQRAKTIGIPANCQFIQGDFMKLPFEDNSFDHVYVIEAVCHAPEKAKCFAEIFRVLKPGGSFAGYDWCLTDIYDKENPIHNETKRLIEEGDALPELKTTHQLISDLKSVGFTIEENQIIPEGDIPWYQPLKGGDSFFSLNNLRASSIGRWLTRNMVWFMEKTWIAAQGSIETLEILEKAAVGLVRGGESGIFTPYFFFLARKS